MYSTSILFYCVCTGRASDCVQWRVWYLEISYGRKTSRGKKDKINDREGWAIEWYSTYKSSQVFARRHGDCLEAERKWTNVREQLSFKKIITSHLSGGVGYSYYTLGSKHHAHATMW